MAHEEKNQLLRTHNPKIILLLIFAFLLPKILKAEGQDGLGLVLNAIGFVKIFSIWTISTFILLLIIKEIRRREFTKKQKYIIWTIALTLAFFNWEMVDFLA